MKSRLSGGGLFAFAGGGGFDAAEDEVVAGFLAVGGVKPEAGTVAAVAYEDWARPEGGRETGADRGF